MAASQHGARLGDVLAAWLPEALERPFSKGTLRRLVMAGAVRVDGRPARRPGLPVAAGSLLQAAVDLEKLAQAGPSRDRAFVLTVRDVLYEDAVLIAVDKPPGLPTHATADPNRENLFGIVKRFLADRSPEPYLGLHQRLDRDTSGIVLFTKDPVANPGLAGLFAGREVAKRYLALTMRPARLPASTWRVANRLAAGGTGRRARTASVSVGGDLAVTEFTRLESFDRALLIEARPQTGRKHQIRVHLAEAGLPILGDESYGRGSAGPTVPRVMLHAARLAFRHPLTGDPIVVESPLPADFARVLKTLRAEPKRHRR